MASIEEAILQCARDDLSSRVTPLDQLEHLSQELDFDLSIKRDDLTDLALGSHALFAYHDPMTAHLRKRVVVISP